MEGQRQDDDTPELLIKLQERKERHKQRHIVHRSAVVRDRLPDRLPRAS